ncbi:MAG: DNA-binding response regulator [Sulfurovum sp.]|nr:MAG: DNA-binding response regulator [Sulfurovum sp.]
MNKNILIVEDESIVAMEIESYLLSLNYNVVAICSSADEAYKKAISNDIDLVLMDIYLIESDGIEATIRIKKIKPNLPIIFLSAYMDEETIDRAIEVNPEAYLTKPFNRKDLAVSIKIALKNKESIMMTGDIILDNEFSFDTKSLELICCGENVSLTKKERTLLILFLKQKNHLITIEKIEYELWPNKPSNDSRRRSLVSRLRAKLKHKFIETHASEGYVFRI